MPALSKAETLAAVAQWPTLHDDFDWVICITPEDKPDAKEPEIRNGVPTYPGPAGCRIWMWVKKPAALEDAMAGLADFQVSGLPDDLLDNAMVDVPIRDGAVRMTLREMVEALASSRAELRREALRG